MPCTKSQKYKPHSLNFPIISFSFVNQSSKTIIFFASFSIALEDNHITIMGSKLSKAKSKSNPGGSSDALTVSPKGGDGIGKSKSFGNVFGGKGSSKPTDGGYLIFSTSNAGMMTLTMSKEPVSDALCYFSPKKTIPDFKYTQNAGRTELIRNMGADMSKYYEGIAAFIKIAASYDGDLYILSASKFSIYLLEGNQVKEVKEGAAFNLSNADAAAVVPRGSEVFAGVKTSTASDFVNKASRYGAKWKR